MSTILDEAAAAVNGPRREAYDHPLKNHCRIAELWNAYLGGRYEWFMALDERDVVWMMIQVKCARDIHSPRRDNLVDVAGYAACLEQMDHRYAAEATQTNPVP